MEYVKGQTLSSYENKKKLTDFVSNVNDNPEVKEKFYKSIEDSKTKKYMSVTYTFNAQSREHLETVYAALKASPLVSIVL